MNCRKSKYLQIAFLLFFSCHLLIAQTDSISSTPLNKKRLALVVGSEAVSYGGTMHGLNALWYKDFPRSSFHFFNANSEWLQMDKVGHTVTSYYIGRVGIGLMKWSGVERKKAIWYGGMLGFLYQTNIELLDGFSSQWGFSMGDATANTVGSLMVIGQ